MKKDGAVSGDMEKRRDFRLNRTWGVEFGPVLFPLFLLVMLSFTGCINDEREKNSSDAGSPQPFGTSSSLSDNTHPSRPFHPALTYPGPGAFPGKGKNPFSEPDPPPVPEPNFSHPGGTFLSPLRIHLTDTGWLLVSDSKRNAILRVDPVTLQPDQALPLTGKPLGVGMLGGEIFVGLKEKKAIEVFSSTGAQKGYLANPGQAGHPGDLAIDPAEGLVLALDGLARVVRLYRAADRSVLGEIGAGQLTSPAAITADPLRREVLVSDYGSSSEAASVKIFSYAPENFGSSLGAISGSGNCNWFSCSGGFSRPQGAAVHDGKVYLPDIIYGQVLVYDRETLARAGELGSSDPAARDLQIPSDVAINSAGNVFVTSTLAKAVVGFPGGLP